MRELIGIGVPLGISLIAQAAQTLDPMQFDWLGASLEYGLIGVVAYIFYRLWSRSLDRKDKIVNDRITELEKERDEQRKRADTAVSELLKEIRDNRSEYRDFLTPYLTINPNPSSTREFPAIGDGE